MHFLCTSQEELILESLVLLLVKLILKLVSPFVQRLYLKAALYDALLLQMSAFQIDYLRHVRKSH